jgi:hypothetical protein
MSLNISLGRQLLQSFDLKRLFVDELGWDHPPSNLEIFLNGQPLKLNAIA